MSWTTLCTCLFVVSFMGLLLWFLVVYEKKFELLNKALDYIKLQREETSCLKHHVRGSATFLNEMAADVAKLRESHEIDPTLDAQLANLEILLLRESADMWVYSFNPTGSESE